MYTSSDITVVLSVLSCKESDDMIEALSIKLEDVIIFTR